MQSYHSSSKVHVAVALRSDTADVLHVAATSSDCSNSPLACSAKLVSLFSSLSLL